MLSDHNSESDSETDEETGIKRITLAKKMVRSKERNKIINASVNRYNYDDNDEDLPSWFLEDEYNHNKPIPLISNKEIEDTKNEYANKYNVKTIKKVVEAKNRKKRKTLRKIKKLKDKYKIMDDNSVPTE